jgi:hypothetical protein
VLKICTFELLGTKIDNLVGSLAVSPSRRPKAHIELLVVEALVASIRMVCRLVSLYS